MIAGYETIFSNIDDCFQDNRKFVVPIAGAYKLDWTFVRDSYRYGGTYDDVMVDLYVNGKPIEATAINGQTMDKDKNSASAHVILQLQQNDEVSLYARSEGGQKRYLPEVLFSGHLIGAG